MMMRRYNQRVFLWLLAIFFGLGCFNWLIDPFERNGRIDVGLPKKSISPILSYQMYKIMLFDRNPAPDLVLGDSRSLALKEEYFTALGVGNLFNFAYGGGTLYEAIDTFWYATEKTSIRRVILGVPFSIFNERASTNRFATARQVAKNPLSYYLSPLVTKASAMTLLTGLTGHEFVTDRPDMSRAEFWAYQLGPASARYYSNWKQPDVLWTRLKQMVDYCDEKNIELVFYIPPSHTDQQALLEDYDLRAEFLSYKQQLARLGRVVDYDVPSVLTKNRENFLDPHHCTDEVARTIVAEIVDQLQMPNRSNKSVETSH